MQCLYKQIETMENQKSLLKNPILFNTSRQFYTRKHPNRLQTQTIHLDKLLKLFTNDDKRKENEKKIRLKTQNREQIQITHRQLFRNQIKLKIQSLIRREHKLQKQFYDSYEKIKTSLSRQSFIENQITFYSKFYQIIQKLEKSNDKIENNIKIKQHKTRQKDRVIEIQNLKLFKQNQALRQKMLLQLPIQPDSKNSFESVTKFKEGYENSLQTIIDQRSAYKNIENTFGENQKLENQFLKEEIAQLKELIQFHKEDKKIYADKIAQLKNSNENLCQEVVKIKSISGEKVNKIQKWKFIMSMQSQQITSCKVQMQMLRKQNIDLNRKYKNMLRKINKISQKSNGKLQEISKKSAQIFNEQLESFQKMRNCFITKGFFSTNRANSNDSKTAPLYKTCFNDKQTMDNSNGIKRVSKQYYNYYKPTFYIYLEKYFEYQGVDKSNFEHIDLDINIDFLISLRAILDSKSNEFLFTQRGYKEITNFPAFCISWLSNFQIDTKTKKIKQIKTDICFETISTFYVRLMNESLNINWEIVTFRQFLLETLSIDQLYFYLKAREVFFKGQTLAVVQGYTSQILHINYIDALFIIQKFVSDFDYRKKIEEYIKRSIIYDRKKQLIDGHYILRLLLEFYQYQKSKKLNILSKTFANYTKQKNCHMPFETYLKIFDYEFFDLTLTEKVQIYNKSFSLTKGQINLQSIFTVLNQGGFFCHQVEKLFQIRQIQKNIDSLTEETIFSPNNAQIKIIQNYFQSTNEGILSKEINRLGLQSLKVIKQNYTKCTFENLLKKIEYILLLGIVSLKKLYSSQKIKNEEYLLFAQPAIRFCKQFIDVSIGKRDTLELLQQTRKNNAARQIFNFYHRKKHNLNYNPIDSIDNFEKFKEKSEEIKRQFQNIIDELRKKYKPTKKLKSGVDLID